jgi:hypothetical protein
MASESGLPGSPQDDTARYVGLPADIAEQQAREHGWDTVRTLPPDAIITMEFLSGRLNFTVRDGTVERCWQG